MAPGILFWPLQAAVPSALNLPYSINEGRPAAPCAMSPFLNGPVHIDKRRASADVARSGGRWAMIVPIGLQNRMCHAAPRAPARPTQRGNGRGPTQAKTSLLLRELHGHSYAPIARLYGPGITRTGEAGPQRRFIAANRRLAAPALPEPGDQV
jgi:hypothetical protein